MVNCKAFAMYYCQSKFTIAPIFLNNVYHNIPIFFKIHRCIPHKRKSIKTRGKKAEKSTSVKVCDATAVSTKPK